MSTVGDPETISARISERIQAPNHLSSPSASNESGERQKPLDANTCAKILKAKLQENQQTGHVSYLTGQDLNEMFKTQVPQAAYDRLRDAGFSYLPHLLSIWAMDNRLEPANLLLVNNEERDELAYEAQILKGSGLSSDANLVWNALPLHARNRMVNLYLTPKSRVTFSPSSLSYPIPTVEQAMQIIHSDVRLSPEEKQLAAALIPIAVDKKGAPLFLP